jgi:hypothetical protein
MGVGRHRGAPMIVAVYLGRGPRSAGHVVGFVDSAPVP